MLRNRVGEFHFWLELLAELREYSVGDISSDIGKSVIPAGIIVGQFLVIQTEQVKDRGVPIVSVHAVVDGFTTYFVGRSVIETSFDSAACHPRGVSLIVMAPTAAGSMRRTPELACPDHQRILQHVTLFQISEQTSDRFVDGLARRGQLFRQLRVVIPPARADLDIPNTGLDHATSKQTLGS